MAKYVNELPVGLRQDSVGNGVYVGSHYTDVRFQCDKSPTAKESAIGSCSDATPEYVYVDDANATIYIPAGASGFLVKGPEDGIENGARFQKSFEEWRKTRDLWCGAAPVKADEESAEGSSDAELYYDFFNVNAADPCGFHLAAYLLDHPSAAAAGSLDPNELLFKATEKWLPSSDIGLTPNPRLESVYATRAVQAYSYIIYRDVKEGENDYRMEALKKLKEHDESLAQKAAADLLLLTKNELLPPDERYRIATGLYSEFDHGLFGAGKKETAVIVESMLFIADDPSVDAGVRFSAATWILQRYGVGDSAKKSAERAIAGIFKDDGIDLQEKIGLIDRLIGLRDHRISSIFIPAILLSFIKDNPDISVANTVKYLQRVNNWGSDDEKREVAALAIPIIRIASEAQIVVDAFNAVLAANSELEEIVEAENAFFNALNDEGRDPADRISIGTSVIYNVVMKERVLASFREMLGKLGDTDAEFDLALNLYALGNDIDKAFVLSGALSIAKNSEFPEVQRKFSEFVYFRTQDDAQRKKARDMLFSSLDELADKEIVGTMVVGYLPRAILFAHDGDEDIQKALDLYFERDGNPAELLSSLRSSSNPTMTIQKQIKIAELVSKRLHFWNTEDKSWIDEFIRDRRGEIEKSNQPAKAETPGVLTVKISQ